MHNEFDIENSPSNIYVPLLIKSIGEEDSDGNYIFEVEASNENLDLQNQRIQQNALLKSKEFFITNGVISDDHQHKRYDKDGNIISDKSKIIGEPISVRTEGTSTFVKGKLYGSVAAAKDFIKLLKAHSSRVKASVGGIMPTVKKNPDGTETVTAFRWNDLALTCSPVNYTVGSAVFAKSVSNLDFCKALSAGCGTDSATMTGGRALQGEDLEKTSTNIIPEKEIGEEAEVDAINELMAAVGTGEIKTRENMEAFLVERGYSQEKARAAVREIILQGGHTIMAKGGSLFGQVNNILKSFGSASSENADDDKDKKKPDETGADGNSGSGTESGNGTSGEGGEAGNGDGGNDEGNNINKSLPDGYSDATDVLNNILVELKKSNDAVAALTQRMDDYEAQQEDVSKSILGIASGLAKVASAPVPPKSATSIMKSDVGGGAGATASGGALRPTTEDYAICKSALNAAFRDRANSHLTLEHSEHLSSAFQRAVRGGKISREDYNEIAGYVRKYSN